MGHSIEECDYTRGRLHRKIEEGLEILSGLQQPDHPTSADHAAQLRDNWVQSEQALYDVVRDIAKALTGKDIKFEEDPYRR